MGVDHGRDVVDKSLVDPRANVVAHSCVDLFGRVYPCADLGSLARPAADHVRHAAHPVGQDGNPVGGVFGAEHRRASAGRGCQVELYAVCRVVVGQFLEQQEVVLSQVVIEEAGPPLGGAHCRIGRALGSYPQACEKVHALVVCPVDEHGQRVQAAVDEALHVVPDAVVGRGLEPSRVVPEAQPHLGRVEQAVAASDAVDEGVDGGSRALVDGYPGVLEGHRRLEHEQIVVPGVVEVDRPLSFHGGFVSGFVVGYRVSEEKVESVAYGGEVVEAVVDPEGTYRAALRRGSVAATAKPA